MRFFPRTFLRRVLGPRGVAVARSHLSTTMSRIYGNNLHALAAIWRCDKQGLHDYADAYNAHFKKMRRRRVNLLEIGVGGYKDPNKGGASLRMWKWYFRRAEIHGVDLYDKSGLQEHRIHTHKGSQDDEAFLRNVVRQAGRVDIVIDDGSHLNRHVIRTFEILFPLLSENGIYVIEDMQTAFWPAYGGKLCPDGERYTSVDFMKSRIDGLNYLEFLVEEYQPSYFDRHIVSIHFYHNLCFIYKGANVGQRHWLRDRDKLLAST